MKHSADSLVTSRTMLSSNLGCIQNVLDYMQKSQNV